MPDVIVAIGDERFEACFLDELSPRTCAAVRKQLPWRENIVHVRWSGEACWIPLGNLQFDVGYENATSYPSPGEFIYFPGGISEAEILVAYGPTSFASKAGKLAGNPFLMITNGHDRLARLGSDILWRGAREIKFELAGEGKAGVCGVASSATQVQQRSSSICDEGRCGERP